MADSAPSKYWILPLLAGVLYVCLGVWVLRTPQDSYVALAFLFALSFLVSGIIESWVAISERAIRPHWGWMLAGGILDLLIGLMLLNNPSVSVAVLPFVVGFALLFRSCFAVSGAFALKSAGGKSWGTVMLFGVLGLIASFILLWNPVLAGMTIVVWTGLACIAVGITRVMAAFAIRKGEQLVA
ncbi:MAG TPA: DUF308 domain-containing protein [Gemmatimonadaceae bacterium]|nr:DUF308 domain-containing protein [Gemmatimonadaceae bacterium]